MQIRNKTVFTILFFMVLNCAFSQDLISIKFDIDFSLSRDNWGKIIYSGEYAQAHFRLSSKSPIVLIFDYNNILNSDSTFCRSLEVIENSFKNDINSPAYLYIENEKGVFVSPEELCRFYIGRIYVPDWNKDNNYDILPIRSGDFKFFDYPLDIPVQGLKEMCGESQKIRFHYFYKPIDKFKQFNNNTFHIISNWYNIDDIK